MADGTGNPLFKTPVPASEDYLGLIRKLLAGDILFHQLTPEQQDFARNTTHKCPAPGCGKQIPLYDSQKARIRHACSRQCLGIIRRRRKWECILCHRIFLHSEALIRHIAALHPDITLHQYLLAWHKEKGGNPEDMAQYCPFCRRERKLDFANAKYKPCYCQNLANKLVRLEKQLSETTDAAARKHIIRQINGCRGKLKQSPKISKKKALKPQAPPPAAPPPATATLPTKSLVTVPENFDFKEFATYFTGLMAFTGDIFNSYYNLVRAVKDKKMACDIKRANDQLLDRLQSQGWTTTIPKRLTYLAFVYAYRPEATDFTSSPENLTPYFKELPGDPNHIAEQLAKLRYDKAVVGQFLQGQNGKLPYPVAASEPYQAGFRIVSSDFSGKPTFIFSPEWLYKIDCLYQKAKASQPGNSTEG